MRVSINFLPNTLYINQNEYPLMHLYTEPTIALAKDRIKELKTNMPEFEFRRRKNIIGRYERHSKFFQMVLFGNYKQNL